MAMLASANTSFGKQAGLLGKEACKDLRHESFLLSTYQNVWAEKSAPTCTEKMFKGEKNVFLYPVPLQHEPEGGMYDLKDNGRSLSAGVRQTQAYPLSLLEVFCLYKPTLYMILKIFSS